MSDQKHIEKKLRRMAGMSGDKLETLHKANASTPWRARCWNCRNWNIATRSELKICSHCGVNLWSRNG